MEMKYVLHDGDALVVVDVQNCFLPGGKLGIAGSDVIIEPINRMMQMFAQKGLPIALSRDWHPPDHVSFKEQGGPWPAHGIAGTDDAAFASTLVIPAGAAVFSKATGRTSEEYSGFHAKSDTGQALRQWLEEHQIKRVWIVGLATDYCVLNTVLDLQKAGYTVFVLTDAVHAVDITTGNGERALAAMAAQGAQLVETSGVEG